MQFHHDVEANFWVGEAPTSGVLPAGFYFCVFLQRILLTLSLPMSVQNLHVHI